MFMVCVTETHFRTFLVALTECDSRGVQVDVHVHWRLRVVMVTCVFAEGGQFEQTLALTYASIFYIVI